MKNCRASVKSVTQAFRASRLAKRASRRAETKTKKKKREREEGREGISVRSRCAAPISEHPVYVYTYICMYICICTLAARKFRERANIKALVGYCDWQRIITPRYLWAHRCIDARVACGEENRDCVLNARARVLLR